MTFTQLFIASISLNYDCFLISLWKGCTNSKLSIKSILRGALILGILQGVMPLLGWMFGGLFFGYIARFEYWIAFGLLIFIGRKLILKAGEFKKCKINSNIIGLGIVLSIDVLVIGFALSFEYRKLIASFKHLSIIFSLMAVIAITTFITSFLGMYLNNKLLRPLVVKWGIIVFLPELFLLGMGVRSLMKFSLNLN